MPTRTRDVAPGAHERQVIHAAGMATPTAAYSIRLRVRLDNRPGTLGQLAQAIGPVLGDLDTVEQGPVAHAMAAIDAVARAKRIEWPVLVSGRYQYVSSRIK